MAPCVDRPYFGTVESTCEENGWQMAQKGFMDRAFSLFNCQTLSDVVFHVGARQIPAHSFVLASSSPVLHHRLFEAPVAADGGRSRLWRLTAAPQGGMVPSAPAVVVQQQPSVSRPLQVQVDFPADAFFEFLRFLYTDRLTMSLNNVLALVFLADDFKVPSLSDQCMLYLRAEVRPEAALRILSILRCLLCKAVLCLWRETVERRQAMANFDELNMVERNKRLESVKQRRGGITPDSRRASFSSQAPGMFDDAVSVVSHISGKSEESGAYQGSDVGWCRDLRNPADVHRLTDAGRVFGFLTRSRDLYFQFAAISEELSGRCWKCLREKTELALSSPDWLEQDLAVVQMVMSLDVCSITEIALFRALNLWAESRCRALGLPLLPEYRRQVLGEDTIHLVRFPVMTLGELQWEVVPTGVLDHEDVRQLQQAMAHHNQWIPRFNGKRRFLPLRDLIAEQQVGAEEFNAELTRRSAVTAPPPPCYAVAADDELDAVLGARLWRSRVEAVIAEQGEVGVAFEAGVPVGVDLDTRPVLCGNPMRCNKDARPKSVPHRLVWQGGIGGTGKSTRSPMMLLTKELRSEAGRIKVDEDEALLTAPAPTPVTPQTPPFSRQIGVRDTTSAPGAGPASLRPPQGKPQPQDFRRMAKGLYRYRGDRFFELRIETGTPVVYEAPGSAPTTAEKRYEVAAPLDRRPAFGMGPGNVRLAKMGVPLGTFLDTL